MKIEDINTFDVAKKEYEKAYKVVVKANSKLFALKALLDKLCTHETIVVEVNYVAGGYLDQGYEERWVECTECGEKSEVTRKSTGFT
jgi:hypothetical protein